MVSTKSINSFRREDKTLKSKGEKSQPIAYLLLLPTFLFLIVFSYTPAVQAILYSFTDWDGFNAPSFIGFDNFIEVFQDPVMLQSFENLLIWTGITLVIGLIVPFIGAELIFHLKSKGSQYWYRVLFVIPMVIPGMVTLLIWGFIYEPNIGLLNNFLRVIGLGHMTNDWLSNPGTALFSLAFIGFPWISGLNFLIYYAGLQNISESILDSAMLDGCKTLTRVFRIDIPLLRGQFKLLLILGLIGGLQNVTTPLVLTNGGPGYDTYVPGLYMYVSAFQQSRFGYAMAISIILFLITILLTVINLKFVKTDTDGM